MRAEIATRRLWRTAVLALLATPQAMAAAPDGSLDRTVLPIQEPARPLY